MKAIKIRKRIEKEKTIFLTTLPEKETIRWDDLIGYCRENLIPLANLPEELVNRFRVE